MWVRELCLFWVLCGPFLFSIITFVVNPCLTYHSLRGSYLPPFLFFSIFSILLYTLFHYFNLYVFILSLHICAKLHRLLNTCASGNRFLKQKVQILASSKTQFCSQNQFYLRTSKHVKNSYVSQESLLALPKDNPYFVKKRDNWNIHFNQCFKNRIGDWIGEPFGSWFNRLKPLMA